jgi:hypothetical protein
MAYKMRVGGSPDRNRAAGGSESIPSAGDLDGQTVATGKSAAAVGQRNGYSGAISPRWFALGLGRMEFMGLGPPSRDVAGSWPSWVGLGLGASGCWP